LKRAAFTQFEAGFFKIDWAARLELTRDSQICQEQILNDERSEEPEGRGAWMRRVNLAIPTNKYNRL